MDTKEEVATEEVEERHKRWIAVRRWLLKQAGKEIVRTVVGLLMNLG